jgi:hypothetical protein
MIYNLGIKVYPEDKVKTVPPPELGIGSRITITRATEVNITDAKVTTTYHTWTETVKQLFAEKGIVLLGQDSSSPDLSSNLKYNMQIKITRVSDVEVSETEVIKFQSTSKKTVDLEKGQTSIQTKGINGEKKVTYTIHRVDGVEVSKTVKSSEITKQPQTEVTLIGIGPKLAKSGPYVDTINGAAKKYLINGTALMCLMLKESNGNSGSVNPDGPYYGLFQFSDGFWDTASSGAGYGGSSWSNPTAQIYSAAWALTHGYGGRWGGTWPLCRNK